MMAIFLLLRQAKFLFSVRDKIILSCAAMLADRSHRAALNSLLRAEIDKALTQKGISARAVSIAVAGHDGLIRDIRAGNVPTADRVAALCDALGLEFYIGPPRDRPGQTISLAGDDFASVPLYEPTASAGPGDVVEGEAATAHFAFRIAWMRNRGIPPARAALFRVHGDSMAPTIPDQAIILVDRSAVGVHDRRIYLVRQGDALYIKRLRRDPSGAFIATSDNPAGDAFTLDPSAGESPVLGQVRWASRALEDTLG